MRHWVRAALAAVSTAATLAGATPAFANAGPVARPWYEHSKASGNVNTGAVTTAPRVTTDAHMGRVVDTGTDVIAANGDVLHYVDLGPADSSGVTCPADMPILFTYEVFGFVGGTGRFAGATGSTVSKVCLSFSPTTGDYSYVFDSHGTISY